MQYQATIIERSESGCNMEPWEENHWLHGFRLLGQLVTLVETSGDPTPSQPPGFYALNDALQVRHFLSGHINPGPWHDHRRCWGQQMASPNVLNNTPTGKWREACTCGVKEEQRPLPCGSIWPLFQRNCFFTNVWCSSALLCFTSSQPTVSLFYL
jgi:hypothetical protein